METAPTGNIATNEALLFLDLTGQTEIEMEFYWKEFGDENDTDGLLLSDDNGATYTRITYLNGGNYTNNTWKKIVLDLDDLAAEYGLTFNDKFVVRFLHRDNFFIDESNLSKSDGFAFDDIVVRVPAACTPTYATLPFVDGFESGDFGTSWCIPNTSFARTEVSDQHTPNTGTYHMIMDTDLTGTDARNEAWLNLDLSAETEVEMTFSWKEFNDGLDAGLDGIFFSDDAGASFVEVTSLNGSDFTDETWQEFTLDVDQLATDNGLTLTSTFVVKFQHFDTEEISADGFAFDDISVTAVVVCTPTYLTTLPYVEDFELGTFGTEWCIPSNSFARTIITSDHTPFEGSNHLTMDANPSGNAAINEALLHIDLSGEADVQVDFMWKEFNDGYDGTNDGIFFSDDGGTSYTKVTNLDGSNYVDDTWQYVSLDMDELADEHGLTLSSTFIIKFEHLDTESITSDGFAFDLINVYVPTACTPTYATFPYTTGFESGIFDAEWCIPANSHSRTQVTTDNTPNSGTYHMTLDVNPGGNDGRNRALLHVDLAGRSNVSMTFNWKDFGEELNVSDGIFLSDDGGATFTGNVLQLDGPSTTDNVWQLADLDIDALATANGLALNATFVIMFQSFDDYFIDTSNFAQSDGLAFDDIALFVGPTTWSGATDTDWNTATNWSNGIPVDGAEVTIPDVSGASTNDPVLSSGADASFSDLTIDAGAQLTINTGFTINITGDLDNQGTASVGLGTFNFSGTADQNIAGTTTFENMTINNTGGNVILAADQTVNGALTLTDGVVESGANTLILSSGSSANEGSAASFVDGLIRKVGAGDFVFPMGDASTWAPIEIANLTGDAATEFTAQYFHTAYADITNFLSPDGNGDLNNVSGAEYWTLDNSGTSSNVDLTLHWKVQANSGIDDYADLVMAHYKTGDTEWENLGMTTISGADPGSITVTGVSSFSPFTFGSASAMVNPLPIELRYFSATNENDQVNLSWVTSSETNNDKFIVSKSKNGRDYQEMKTIDGAGTSTTENTYGLIDENPYIGLSYYKLTQVDFDGHTSSVMISSNFSSERVFSLSPNPLSNGELLNVEFNNLDSRKVSIRIVDVLGNAHLKQEFNLEPNTYQHLEIDVSNLFHGIYYVTIEGSLHTYRQRLIIK
jgi:hypothetical protein